MIYDLFHISLTIMDKSLGTLAFLGVFQFTQAQPLPSAHKQCWTRVSRIFFRVLTLHRVGEGELRESFEKDELFYAESRMTEKYEYCTTVSSIFVHDCSLCRAISFITLYIASFI